MYLRHLKNHPGHLVKLLTNNFSQTNSILLIRVELNLDLLNNILSLSSNFVDENNVIKRNFFTNIVVI